MKLCVTFIAVLGTILLANAADAQINTSSCLEGQPIPLGRYVNPRTGAMCPDGYLCPNSTLADNSTWPAFCPPTLSCWKKRQNYEMCEPQGTYEVIVCPEGYYCPDNRKAIKCPKGYYCPIGSHEKKKCGGMSVCPEGTNHELDLSGVFVALLCSVMLIALIAFYKRWRASLNERSIEPQGWAHLGEDKKQLIKDGIVDRRGEMDPLNFNFQDLHLEVENKKTKESKVLLQSLNGRIRPGSVTAIMGPSGAGKTIFFTTLLNKIGDEFTRNGKLDINGNEHISEFKQHIGYVPQDDVLHGELTVEDNVYYSSELRLPAEWPAERRDAYRAAVMDTLELGKVRNVIIGDDENRGISGGQRKRTSIALELAAAPAALFLDEPTTGLDATTALDLCTVLNNVASNTGMTVAMVIHQPRVEIWNALDQVLFIAPGGFTVFQGSREDAKGYFEENIGLDFSIGNPADVIIDGINNNKNLCIEAWQRHYKHIATSLHEPVTPADETDAAAPAPATAPAPVSPYVKPAAVWDSTTNQKGTVSKVQGASFPRQIILIHNRSILKQLKNFQFLFMYILLGMIAAAVMGSAAVREQFNGLIVEPYTYLTPKPRFYIIPMLSMFYLIAIASTDSAVAIRAFGGETTQFWRESSTGSLHRLAYYLGTSFAELYRLFLTSLFFAIVAYIMWSPIQQFWTFYLLQLLSFLCFDAQAADLGMLIRQESAPLLTSIFGVFVALLNGFPGIPVVGVISFTWYAAEALVTANALPYKHLYMSSTYEEFFDYTLDRETVDYLVMFIIFLLYKLIGFIFIMVLNRDKQR